MKQDMIVILDLGSHENTVLARAIRALGVYSEIYPHDITVEELKALPNVKGIIINGGPNNVIDCGRVEASGTHLELLKTSPTYNNLVEKAKLTEKFQY